jgi:hypothetical protein
MGTVLDLDKRRAEYEREPHEVRLDGELWRLPNPLPVVVAQDLAMGNVRAVIAATFGAEAAEKARRGIEDEDEAQRAADVAAAKVVGRVGRFLTDEELEAVLDELYDMETGKARRARKSRKKQRRDDDGEDTESPRD